jgi:DNA-directed RNA polymerase sigma subunit (sigma70/sigma32)
MAGKRIQKKMSDFIQREVDLISEYDSIEGVDPFDYCKYDAMDRIEMMMKSNKSIDFRAVMIEALNMSIRYNQSLTDSLFTIQHRESSDNGSINITQAYFREIGNIYKNHDGDLNLEYCPENREKLIELNTKMVISVAKKYQGLGLTLNELISAGNLGLCVAWEKFDPNKAKLKDDTLAAVQDLPESFPFEDLVARIDRLFTYGSVRKKFDDRFTAGNTYTKKEVLTWIDQNIYNAKFSSICMMWIKAFILIEIDNFSRMVKKPKSEIYKDKKSTGRYQKETLLDLDRPIGHDTDTTFADTLGMIDEDSNELDVLEAYDTYKENLKKMLTGVPARDRQVVLKKFGIGLPRPMLPKEIADQTGLSVARISQIFQLTMEKIRKNCTKYNIDPQALFECCEKFR